mgnify:CR=1 FL=1
MRSNISANERFIEPTVQSELFRGEPHWLISAYKSTGPCKRQSLKQEEKRDAIFSQVADEIGVESKDLIRRVGKEKSLNINKIQLDNELLKKIISNDSKVIWDRLSSSCRQKK